MKRLFAWLLALCLLALAMPAALAGQAISEPAPELPESGLMSELPAPGDVVNGFEVVELRGFPLIGAQVVRFEHQKTGAELYYIANDDTNRAFDLTFFTDAVDNTGLPHVFEHATLQGCEKYPNRGLFFNLSFQTYNTFMNAMTGQRYTTFPCASLSEAQLLKLADYYTDSCLHPMIMQDEDIYRTEAWRYRLEKPEDELTLEGTVYSEMLGATTLNRAAVENVIRAAFPGSMVGNNYGGDPEAIPDMTWEMLKDYHDRYYHPSNCAAYLYGQFEDYAAFLELLDGYFSAYERREFTRSDDGYAPIDGPVTQSLAFPVEQGSDTEHASDIYYAFVCPGLRDEPEQALLMNTLTDLLYDDASGLQQSLQAALPYGSFFSYIELDGPEYAILFGATNVNAGDAETFRQIVDESLREVAANGFPQEQVDAVMASLAIDAQLIRESQNVGVEGVIDSMAGYYASTGNPWEFLDYEDGLTRMDEWNRQGLYAGAVSRWLADSRTTALVTTYPEPGAKDRNDAALAEKLAGIKAAIGEEEIAAIVEATNAAKEDPDNGEYLAQLQAVTVESLPEELKRYEVTDGTDEAGVRRIDAVAGVEGIGQATVYLDAAGLATEDVHWLKLFTDLIGELDTAAHAKAELATLMSRYLYNQRIFLAIPREGENGFHPYLALRWIALDDDLDEGYDLMRELVFDTRLDDPEKLLEQVQSIRAGLKSSITANPASLLLQRAFATTMEKYRYYAYANGLEYYEFLGETQALLESDPDAAVARLQAVQESLNNRSGAVALFCGNEASIALNRGLSDAFLAALDERGVERAGYDIPAPASSEALVIDSGVQYNLLAATYDELGMSGFEGGLNAVTSLVTDEILMPVLRDQYGVYTPQHYAMSEEGVYVLAYRDPNVVETFQVLDELPEKVRGMEIDQEALDGYILSAYSEYAMPKGELTGALEAALDALEGRAQDEALGWMRALKQMTPDAVRAYADMYALLSDNGARMTAGGAAAINASADVFEVIRNPFGAVDNTQVALTDATEQSAHYEAVRFAFEQGFMDPLTGDTFGVDEPATNRDLLASMYVLAGGSKDAEEALAAFVGYGLVPDGTDLDAPIAEGDVLSLMGALVGGAVEPLAEVADPAAVTRGEYAEMLMAFVNSLE